MVDLFLLFAPYGRMIAGGAAVTFGLTAIFIVVGSVLALALTAVRLVPSPFDVCRRAVDLFVAAHRNVPMVVQLLFWYFGAPELLPDALADWINSHSGEFLFAAAALSSCFGAYLSEDLRAGMRSIPRGQLEAAQALGLNDADRFRFIIAPQALRAAWPSIASQSVLFFKATSLAAAIGVSDLANVGQTVNNNSFRTFEVFSVITLIYIGMSWLLLRLFGAVGTRLNKAVPA